MADFVNLRFDNMHSEQLGVLQVMIRIVGDSVAILHENEIFSEDYVAAYSDFFTELGNELYHLQDILFNSGSDFGSVIDYAIDCAHLSVGCDPCEKGGDGQCK